MWTKADEVHKNYFNVQQSENSEIVKIENGKISSRVWNIVKSLILNMSEPSEAESTHQRITSTISSK